VIAVGLYHDTQSRSDNGESMFGNKKKKLEAKYQKLNEEAFKLSTVDRTKSDAKAAEADAVLKELEALEAAEK
jgi:hypothetical protein